MYILLDRSCLALGYETYKYRLASVCCGDGVSG